MIAYYFTSVSNVISIIGATADIYLVFIMPIALYLAYKPKRDWKRYLSILILIFSLTIGSMYLLITFGSSFGENV